MNSTTFFDEFSRAKPGIEVRELIKGLTPFDRMPDEEFSQILKQAILTENQKDSLIFRRNDTDSKLYWLISGSLNLLDANFNVAICKAGESTANNVIDGNSPHELTAISTEHSQILTVEREAMKSLVGGNTDAASEAFVDVNSDSAGTSFNEQMQENNVDWMSVLLSSPLFDFIPPTNIQTLFARFEKTHYASGDVVISQGDEGNYFYVLESGRARVERSDGRNTTALTDLKPGDNFGQDALISNLPRNATVTMLSGGTLMHLSKVHFESLLMRPVIETLSMEETLEMVRQDEPRTCIIDVRNSGEVKTEGNPGSLNIPLLLLRSHLARLDTSVIYVMTDDGGKRAELGAWILNEKGYSAYVLDQQYRVN